MIELNTISGGAFTSNKTWTVSSPGITMHSSPIDLSSCPCGCQVSYPTTCEYLISPAGTQSSPALPNFGESHDAEPKEEKEVVHQPSVNDTLNLVLERLDAVLDRTDVINEKLGCAPAPTEAHLEPKVGDRVWSRATGEGPFFVILDKACVRVSTDQNGYMVDAVIVRNRRGEAQALPIGDVTTQPPVRQKLPLSVYVVASIAASISAVTGLIAGYLLL